MGVILLPGIFFFPVQAAEMTQGATLNDPIQPPYVECCKNDTDHANLRSGPGTADYPIVGILTMGETVPATGRSKVGSWIQIRYPGVAGGVAWVMVDNVIVHYGADDLPIVEAPPTPVPDSIATIDPTFAAQFSSIQPTQKPTYTPATPFATITFMPTGGASSRGGIPPAIIILGLLTLGTFGGIFSAIIGHR
jgi:uncharacterized protein YraI